MPTRLPLALELEVEPASSLSSSTHTACMRQPTESEAASATERGDEWCALSLSSAPPEAP